MGIALEEVQKVSLLARLALTDAEAERMTVELGQILGYVGLLQQVDTEGVEPMAHAADVADVLRDDVPRPSLARDEALASAPHHDGECYRVPAVLGG